MIFNVILAILGVAVWLLIAAAVLFVALVALKVVAVVACLLLMPFIKIKTPSLRRIKQMRGL